MPGHMTADEAFLKHSPSRPFLLLTLGPAQSSGLGEPGRATCICILATKCQVSSNDSNDDTC